MDQSQPDMAVREIYDPESEDVAHGPETLIKRAKARLIDSTPGPRLLARFPLPGLDFSWIVPVIIGPALEGQFNCPFYLSPPRVKCK